MRAVYEASLNGSVSMLNTLIQKDPLILNRVSLSPFSETPLHVAALLGHTQFCDLLLQRKPSMASEADSEGRCPLHLASAEGHTEVVRALLQADAQTCLALDKDDKLPLLSSLHVAIMRGRMGAIEELVTACPHAVPPTIDGDSVLHLCLRYHRLEAFKFLVESMSADRQFLLAKDKEGHTLLHLAVMLRQIKTIKYLVSLPGMATAINEVNSRNVTALDVVESGPRDFISLTISDILTKAKAQRNRDMDTTQTQEAANESSEEADGSGRRRRWEQVYVKYLQYQGNWIEETRGTLMVVATVIATMTFQATISPPGGVWQENTIKGGLKCTPHGICEAGTAVLAYAWTNDFLNFMTFNTTSFFSSLCVVLLLISGFPLKNKVMIWMLTIAMSVSVTFLGLTFMWAQGLITPNHIVGKVYKMGYALASAWGAILFVIVFIHIIRLLFWIKRRKKNNNNNNDNNNVGENQAVL